MQTLADAQGGTNPRARTPKNNSPESRSASVPSAIGTETSWLRQTPLMGLACGIQWDLFPTNFVAEIASVEVEEAHARVSEIDAVYADLQQGLSFDGPRPKYAVPDLSRVAKLPIEARAYCEHKPEHAHVAKLPSDELADRLNWLFLHRGRALSPLDIAIQREWCARALGYGHFYAKQQPWLPIQLVELVGGERAFQRKIVLATLCQALLKRANGIHISAPEAESLWGIRESTWWAVIAWLESRGLLVRLRQFKNTPKREKGQAPVQLDANWYGPGPALLNQRERVLAAYNDKRSATETRAAEHAKLIELRRSRRKTRRRRDQAREQRRRGEAPPIRPGKDAPTWLLFTASLSFQAHAERVLAERAAERATALLEGRTWSEVVEEQYPPIPIAPQSELGAELERLATAQVVPASTVLSHRARVARLELRDSDAASSEFAARDESEAKRLASPANSMADFGQSRRQSITLQSEEGAPAELEEKLKRKTPQTGDAGCSLGSSSNTRNTSFVHPRPNINASPLPNTSRVGALGRCHDEVASRDPTPESDNPKPDFDARIRGRPPDPEAHRVKRWDQLVAELRSALVVDDNREAPS